MATPGSSSLASLTRKTYGSEYHMPTVRFVAARISSSKLELVQGRFFSKPGADLASSYLAELDSVNAGSMETALQYVQTAGINQNARPASARCMRKANMSYIVLYEFTFAQTNETIAQFENTWTVPEYGPYVAMNDGQCASAKLGGKDSIPPECLQLNGDQGQPNLGPFVGAQLLPDEVHAPSPDTYLFSFPNTCPLKPRTEKTFGCRASTRKGLCDLGQAPDGVTCTYAYDVLGWLPLDDLVGITSLNDSSGKPYMDFTTWCQSSDKNVEFAGDVNTGEMDKGLDFWSDPLNKTRNIARAAKLVTLYQDIVAGVVKSELISASDLKYFKALPTTRTLGTENPPCYQSVRTCNSANGCARSGFSQICTPCKAGEACAINASYTLPTLVKAKAAVSVGESDKSSLPMVLIVGGVVVLIVGVTTLFLRRKGYACFGRRDGRQQDKLDPPSPAVDEIGDGIYVDISTDDKARLDKRQLTVSADDVAASPQRFESNAIVEEAAGFPGQLLLAARIPLKDLQIGEVIGHGGFGEVLLATYKNQDVVVKRLLGARRRDPKSVSSFIQEIKLNATLDHECLVRFIGAAWDVRENLCMVSEYVRGGDLRTLLLDYATKGYPNGHDGSKLRTAIQIAQALNYLHSLDPPVVHRDLKSRNVLLTEVLDAKLIDFGVSTECIDETMTAGVGTSLWMAPEIMMGKRYDVKADVFSFGVILSELDTHEIPYDHVRDPDSNRKLASALLNRLIYEGKVKPRFTEMADPEIVALARDCLEVDPSQRPSSAEVLDRIRRCGRQGGLGKSRPDAHGNGTRTLSSHTGTQVSRSGSQSIGADTSLLFETRGTTVSGRPV